MYDITHSYVTWLMHIHDLRDRPAFMCAVPHSHMTCSVLQCVAVYCSILLCVLQCIAACCIVLQRVAVCCSVLQWGTWHDNERPHITRALHPIIPMSRDSFHSHDTFTCVSTHSRVPWLIHAPHDLFVPSKKHKVAPEHTQRNRFLFSYTHLHACQHSFVACVNLFCGQDMVATDMGLPERDMHTTSYVSYMSSQPPYVPVKEPCIPTKEPYISFKKTCTPSQRSPICHQMSPVPSKEPCMPSKQPYNVSTNPFISSHKHLV